MGIVMGIVVVGIVGIGLRIAWYWFKKRVYFLCSYCGKITKWRSFNCPGCGKYPRHHVSGWQKANGLFEAWEKAKEIKEEREKKARKAKKKW